MNRLYIAICDDSQPFVEYLKRLIEEYFEERTLEVSVYTYFSGEELIQNEVLKLDIVFLDIQMYELNGIEVAEILRQRNPDFKLIFVSALDSYARQGYHVDAFRYELKEELPKTLKPTLDALVSELGLDKTLVEFEFVMDGITKIYLEDVIYLESADHIVRFYIKGFEHKSAPYVYEKLNDIQSRYFSGHDCFIRIQQSYLVNMHYIDHFAYNRCYLTTGTDLAVSAKKYKDVRRQHFAFKGKI